jgi:multiple sugar transport system substrate-binding protein
MAGVLKRLAAASRWLHLAVGVLAFAAGASRAEEVVFIGWSQAEVGLRPTLEKLFNDFQIRNPGDKLQVIGFPFGQMEQNLILRRRNDQRMDVAQLQERWLPEFVQMNALYDLNRVVGAETLAASFDPDLLKLGQIDGKQYAIPFTAGAITLVANRNVLRAAGITEPPRTIAEFTAALRKVKAWNKDVIPFGFSTKTTPIIEIEAMIMFWAHGARFIDEQGRVVVDSPQSRAALKYLADLVSEGLIAKGNDRFDTRKLYSADKVAFFFDPPVLRGFVRAQAGGASADAKVMVLPMFTANAGETPRGLLWAHFLVMFNQGGAKGTSDSAGAKLLRAVGMDSSAQAALWSETGQIPTLKTTLADAVKDPYAKAFVDAAKTARWDETTRFANGAELRQIIGEEVEAGMLGSKSIDDAVRSMARRLEGALKEAR